MKHERFILTNGVPLIVVPLSALSSGTLMILVRSGPRFDPPDKPGLSHFVEHLLFRGTKRYPSSFALSSELEKRGAFMQAFSYEEINKYWVKFPKEAKKKVVEILLDCLQYSIFPKKELEQEKEIVKEELRILKSNTESYIWEAWAQNVWQGTPLGKVYLGNEKSIASFTRRDVLDFVEKNYLGQNTVFVASGAVQGEETVKLLNNFLDGYQRKNKQRILLIASTRVQPVKIVKQELENVTCAYGFLTTELPSQEVHSLELISTILTGGWSSWLRQKVMHPGHTYSIASFARHLSDTGYFMIKFTTTKEKLNKVLAIVNQELISLKKGKFSNDELKGAKEYFAGQLIVNTESSEDFAHWYGEQAILNPKEILDIEDKCQIIRRVSFEDIQKVAQKYFTSNNWHLSLIGNVKEREIKVDL